MPEVRTSKDSAFRPKNTKDVRFFTPVAQTEAPMATAKRPVQSMKTDAAKKSRTQSGFSIENRKENDGGPAPAVLKEAINVRI